MSRRLVRAVLTTAFAVVIAGTGSIFAGVATAAEQYLPGQVAEAANHVQGGGEVSSAQLVRFAVSANRSHVMWVVSYALNVRPGPSTDRRPLRTLSYGSEVRVIGIVRGSDPYHDGLATWDELASGGYVWGHGLSSSRPKASPKPPGNGGSGYDHGVNWDGVAACESTGHWHDNTGNGFYGGLQFTFGTWLAYGGAQFAWRADYASRSEQIVVAVRVAFTGWGKTRPQGMGAWPVCRYHG